ncbi:MAG: hypothetical protein IJH36_13265, partial [Clostridia bacterium]|nr:hypothetical protein [Clostridia bacterium]
HYRIYHEEIPDFLLDYLRLPILERLKQVGMNCGCVGMTKEWLLRDNTTSAETVVKMMFESMPDVMRLVYFAKE